MTDKLRRILIFTANSRTRTTARCPAWFDPETDNSPRLRCWAEWEILLLLADGAAEACVRGHRDRVSASRDFDTALTLAMHVCGDTEEAGKYLDWLSI
jgi:hypothetical protein